MMKNSSLPKTLKLLVRLIVSAVILGAIVARLDTSQVARILPTVSPVLLAASFLLLLGDRMIMAYRWHILIRAKGIDIPFSRVVHMYFVSAFLGLFMPSSVAPDFIRVYLATRHGCPTPDALSSVFLDRFLAFLTLAGLSFLSSVLAHAFTDALHVPAWMLMATSGPMLAAVLIAAAVRYDTSALERRASGRFASKILHTIADFKSSLLSYKRSMSSIGLVAMVCLINHFVYIMTSYTVALALHIEVSFLYLCITVPLVSFLTLVPISLAGLGIQEGAYLFFFSRMGVSSQEAFGIAILIRIVMTLGCLPGGALYLLGSSPLSPTRAGEVEPTDGPPPRQEPIETEPGRVARPNRADRL